MRKLTHTLVSMSLLVPSVSWGLGLGDIKLNSALNQRLDAEIELLSVAKDDVGTMVVSLAPLETFAQAGVERSALLMQLTFDVQRRDDGSYYIDVTTARPVPEPFLDFIVEVNWRSGRLLREYTLLLDPPEATGDRPPVLSAPTAAPPVPRTRPAAVPAPAPRVGADAPLVYGPVKPDDTLWSIAKAMRPDASVSIHQMIAALRRANPDAFLDGDVNRLMKGAVLRIDDLNLLTALSKEQAFREFQDDSRAWRETKSDLAADAPERRNEGVSESPARVVASRAQPKLELAAPEGAGAGAGETATAGGSGDATLTSLREEFERTLEQAERQREENAELRERLSELENQLSSLQQLLNLKEESLAALQDQLRSDAAPAPQPAMPAGQSSAPAAAPGQATAPADSAPAATETASSTAAESTAQNPETAEPVSTETIASAAPQPAASPEPVQKPAPAAQTAPPPRPAAPAPAPEAEGFTTGIFDMLMRDPVLLGGAGGLVLILALLLILIVRRRMGKGGFQESILTGGTPVLSEDEPSASADTSFLSDLNDDGTIHTEDTEVDPLTEADVYMAYGRHQQAEDLLKDAIKREPKRPELLVKLLEVYYATRNSGAFAAQADAAFTALGGTGPLWQKVQAMGHELCPDNPLFADAPEGVEPPEEGDGGQAVLDDVLDIGLDLDALAAEMEPGDEEDFASPDRASGDDDLDLDLDFSGLDGSPAKSATQKRDVEEVGDPTDDFGLDLDFSLDDEPEPARQKTAKEDDGLDLDFALDEEPNQAREPADDDLDLGDDWMAGADEAEADTRDQDVDLEAEAASALEEADWLTADEESPATEAAGEKDDENLLEFDSGGFTPAAEQAEEGSATEHDDEHLLDFDLGDFKLDEHEEEPALEIPSVGDADDFTSLGGDEAEGTGKDKAPQAEAAPVSGDDELAFDDLDFGDLGDDAPAASGQQPENADEQAAGLDLDELDFGDLGGETEPAAAPRVDTAQANADEDFGLDDLDFAELDAEREAEKAAEVAPAEPVAVTQPAAMADEDEALEPLDADLDLLDLTGAGGDAPEPQAGEGDDGELDLNLGLDDDFDLSAFGVEEEGADTAALEDEALELESLGKGNSGSARELTGSDLDDLGLGDGDDALDLADDMDLGGDDDLLGDLDEVGTKLDLATAYVEMGDAEGARDMLQEVLRDGDDEQKEKARELLDRVAS